MPERERLSSADWHTRFRQQAAWTRDLRRYLFDRLQLRQARRVLDVGCGTGILFDELSHLTQGVVVGLDINLSHLRLARAIHPGIHLVNGDAHRMPFRDRCFDASLCHFFLLWVDNPLRVLQEMRRLTRPGGFVAALAEPDYGGRIDHPVELVELGHLQGQALAKQGADPLIGRKLASLFNQAGLVEVETGLLGGQWSVPPSEEAWESEWTMLEHDLSGSLSEEKLRDLKEIDRAAWQHGERILFVPTFFAVGRA